MTLDKIGTFVAYAYLLRVPVLFWIGLVALPFLAVPEGAPLGPVFRGLFSLGDLPKDSWANVMFFGPLAFALVTFASFMTAVAIAVTARLILLDGQERFGLPEVEPQPGIELLSRLLPLLVPFAIVGGAALQSRGNLSRFLVGLGIAAGFAVFVVVMQPLHDWLWNQTFGRRPTTALAWPVVQAARAFFRVFTWFVQWTPAGFVDPRTGQIWGRHAFAFLQLLLSFAFYVALFIIKLKVFGAGPARVPTICYLLILAMMGCWALAGLSFIVDRFRVPLLAVLIAYGVLISVFPEGDHFFSAVDPIAGTDRGIDAARVLARRAGRPAIVVATEGGGIQAAAWTTRVLAGLQSESHKRGDDFDRALVAVSGVSGGAAGAMFFVDAYQSDGRLPPMPSIDDEPSVQAAEMASLDEVARGLTYADLIWTVAPFLKNALAASLKALTGEDLLVDRGTALENAWKRTKSLESATLDAWRRDLADQRKPAVIFNATVAETGQQILLGTTTMPTSHGRIDSATDPQFPNTNLAVVTAARLSATFPIASPPARLERSRGSASHIHIVDGGYYDNYGTATLLDWLEQGLAETTRP